MAGVRVLVLVAASLIAAGCGGSATGEIEHDLTKSLDAKGPVSCAKAFNGDISCRSTKANGGRQDCTAIRIRSGPRSGEASGSCHIPGREHADALIVAHAVKRVRNLPLVGRPRSISCTETPAGETWSCRARGSAARADCVVLARDHTGIVGLFCEQTR